MEESSYFVGEYDGPKYHDFVLLDELLTKIGGAVQPDFENLVNKLKLILYRRREILRIKSPKLKSLGFSTKKYRDKEVLNTEMSRDYQINIFQNKHEFNQAKMIEEMKHMKNQGLA